MAANPIKMLVTSVDAFGHFNASLGLAESLHKRGNDVYFANRRKHRASVEKRGLKFIALEDFDDSYTEANADFFVKVITKFMLKAEMTPFERLEKWDESDDAIFLTVLAELKTLDGALRKIIANLKPDILIGDIIFPIPLFMQSILPCIPLYSANPVALYHESGLPAGAGFSTKGDKTIWKTYRDKELVIYKNLTADFNQWYKSHGIEPPDMYAFRAFARHFGIYIYPEALDYVSDLGSPRANWVRMDFSIREPEETEFTITESLVNKPGALIYLSMGSLGSAHVPLMKRLIATFASSKHRFIVSKGPRGDEFELAENMWGQNYVNQIAILPKVDLVITHGGNNTIVETLYFAKPMIVMPLFFDQLDNAQRFEDLSIGRRVDPFRYEDDEIHKMVDELLENKELHVKIRTISEQLKTSQTRDEVAKKIEETARANSSSITTTNGATIVG